MPTGIPRSEEERLARHQEIYGEYSLPPEYRLGRGAYRTSFTSLVAAFLLGLLLGYLLAGV